jgi:hypothetical protein
MSALHSVIRFVGGERCEVTIQEGALYEIQPDNPEREGHRGRLCRIQALDHPLMPRRARVLFEDTGRIGMVNLSDLIEPKINSTAS